MPDYRTKIDGLLADLRHAQRQVKEEKTSLRETLNHYGAVQEAQKLAQEAAKAVQESAHRQIASVVSKCLETVFGEDAYEFRIEFEKKRGKTEANFQFVRDGQAINPLDAAGGGAVDVASFALRLAALVLSRPRRRKVLILDEPFRFLSKEYRPAVQELLLTLCKEMSMQVVMVTHSAELACGKIIELS